MGAARRRQSEQSLQQQRLLHFTLKTSGEIRAEDRKDEKANYYLRCNPKVTAALRVGVGVPSRMAVESGSDAFQNIYICLTSAVTQQPNISLCVSLLLI
jgi:hypothetical protein